MQNVIRIAATALLATSAALAQSPVNVPLSNPSQPVTLRVSLVMGSIHVTGGSGNQVTVTPLGSERERGRMRGRGTHDDTPPPAGMKRLDLGGSGLSIEEDRNVVTVRHNGPPSGGGVNITVPVNTSVHLRTVNGGGIEVTGISGEIDVEDTNGSIKLTNVSGSVVAHTLNGELVASLDKVVADKPMAFTSLNGKVDVTLPGDTKARLRLKTNNGEVYSDFDVQPAADGSKPVVENNRGGNGRYRIRLDRGMTGTINGGGPEFTFQTMNGDILIHKK